MSQVSPDGQYVVTTINDRGGQSAERSSRTSRQLLRRQFQGLPLPPGVLSDPRDPGLVQPGDGQHCSPCPGADDPQLRADGRRLESRRQVPGLRPGGGKDPYPQGRKLAEYANDPNETQIQYDLYRIPFNDGKGGRPEPIAGRFGATA